jgi:hypothetical protein
MSDVIRGIVALGDDQIRSALKAQFDELLDVAAAAREQNCDSPKNNAAVVYLAAQLMGKVLGEAAQIPFETEDDALFSTRYALMQWLPAFSRREDLHLWEVLMDELLLMLNGDHPSLLVPKSRHRGERDTKLALMKLGALKWNAYLKGRSNLKAKEYQSEISEAFGASWDTIRHWDTSAVAVIIDKHLEDAREGVGEGLCYPEYEENLLWDGNRYRMQAGMSVISVGEFMKKIGKN